MNSPLLAVSGLVLGMTLLSVFRSAAATHFHVQPYQDRIQNPFWQSVLNGTGYLEDFEDRSLNTPYVTGSGGGIYQSGSTPNVDGDDGVVDGRGAGFTWAITGGGNQDLSFSFSPNAAGELPKFAGGVLFGTVSAESGLTLYQQILVYDVNGIEITEGKWKIEVPKISLGESAITKHRFAGIYYEGGISRIVFPDSHNVDHLTYGYAIPEPSTGAMLLTGLGLALSRRRRNHGPDGGGAVVGKL